MPVTTPIPNVSAKMRAQKRADVTVDLTLADAGASVFSTAINTPSPIVRMGKR